MVLDGIGGEALRRIEVKFACHEQYGDWRRVTKKTLDFYQLMLQFLAQRLPSVSLFLDDLKQVDDAERLRILGNPTVRLAIEDAMKWIEQLDSINLVEQVLAAAALSLRKNSDVFGRQASISPDLYQIDGVPFLLKLWDGEQDEDVCEQTFRNCFEQWYKGQDQNLLKPSDSNRQDIFAGLSLLTDVLPVLTVSAFSHVHIMAIIDAPNNSKLTSSSSHYSIPGAFFVTPYGCRNPFRAAESLLHEALHTKLSDIIRITSIFCPGYSDSTSPTITSVWNKNLPNHTNAWAVARALYAFHVYAQISLLYSVMQGRSEELYMRHESSNHIRFDVEATIAFNRARYLGKEIKRIGWTQLGVDGKHLVDWLFSTLDDLASFTLPQTDLGITSRVDGT